MTASANSILINARILQQLLTGVDRNLNVALCHLPVLCPRRLSPALWEAADLRECLLQSGQSILFMH